MTSSKKHYAGMTGAQLGILIGMAILCLAVVGVGFALLTKMNPAVEPAAVAKAPTATPTSIPTLPPTWTSTPNANANCQSDVKDYMLKTLPSMTKFSDAFNLAGSTARIALAPVIQSMQTARQDLEVIQPPVCARSTVALLISAQNDSIDSLLAFMQQADTSVLDQKFQQANIELSNALGQLTALSQGRPTPTPKQIPTSTPFPTPQPTATAQPSGSYVLTGGQIGKWQVKVTKIVIVDSIKSSLTGAIEKAVGRFAILFVSATNRGNSQEFFTPIAMFDIVDSNGLRYEENDIAGIDVQDNYNLPVPQANPDQTVQYAIVYDISLHSNSYILVPGRLNDSNASTVELKIP